MDMAGKKGTDRNNRMGGQSRAWKGRRGNDAMQFKDMQGTDTDMQGPCKGMTGKVKDMQGQGREGHRRGGAHAHDMNGHSERTCQDRNKGKARAMKRAGRGMAGHNDTSGKTPTENGQTMTCNDRQGQARQLDMRMQRLEHTVQ